MIANEKEKLMKIIFFLCCSARLLFIADALCLFVYDPVVSLRLSEGKPEKKIQQKIIKSINNNFN